MRLTGEYMGALQLVQVPVVAGLGALMATGGTGTVPIAQEPALLDMTLDNA